MNFNTKKWISFLSGFLTCLTLIAQKPSVQVSFKIDSLNNPLYNTYKDDIDQIVQECKELTIEGLNDYIAFAQFSDSTSNLKFDIELSTFAENDNVILKEYYLYFNFVDDELESHPHQCLFLSSGAYRSLQWNSTLADSLIITFKRFWKNYMEVNYDEELVLKMFSHLALPLPNSSHYYDDPGGQVIEAILPFPLQVIKLNPRGSEFSIQIKGKNAAGTETWAGPYPVTFRGLVDDAMDGIPNLLDKCVRIGPVHKAVLALPELLDGLVFIKRYQRKNYPPGEVSPITFNSEL